MLLESKCSLGEGPVYDCRCDALYFVDILKCVLFIVTNKFSEMKTLKLQPAPTACMLTSDVSILLLADETGLVLLDLRSGETERLCDIIDDPETFRLNDAKVAPDGRTVFVGGMSRTKPRKLGAASLFCYKYGHVSKALSSVTVSNGMDWDGSLERMYYVDSARKEIQIFNYENGMGHKEASLTLSEYEGNPDGMCLDENGDAFVAMFRGGSVLHIDKNGRLIKEYTVPCSCVTSVCFAGEKMDMLVVTTARGSSEREIAFCNNKAAGNVFVIKPGVRGKKTNKFIVPLSKL